MDTNFINHKKNKKGLPFFVPILIPFDSVAQLINAAKLLLLFCTIVKVRTLY